jgi:hypothetical protein
MTRTKGWLWMSGLKSPPNSPYSFYREIEAIKDNDGKVEFPNKIDNNPTDTSD